VIYLDTSALIKRYVIETGSRQMRYVLRPQKLLATSKVTYAEVYSALTRRRRRGTLAVPDYDLACRQFEREWPAYVRIEVMDEILRSARDLIRKHPLRALDAVHLASALGLSVNLHTRIGFAAADTRLLRAARAEGLEAVDARIDHAP
jgi:predicted nucleic acid-binding protein